jgi:hypothetical protein
MGGSVQNLRENFEAQFEADGEGRYLYRRNQKGEPIPVSAEERERFIRQYALRIRFIMAGMMVALFASLGLVVWWTVATQSNLSEITLTAVILGIATVAIALMYWVRGAPARELDGRTAVGRERSTEEMRAKISYGQLAAGAAFGLFIVLNRALREGVHSGSFKFWLGLGVLLVVVSAIQAFRKWRFETGHPSDVI